VNHVAGDSRHGELDHVPDTYTFPDGKFLAQIIQPYLSDTLLETLLQEAYLLLPGFPVGHV